MKEVFASFFFLGGGMGIYITSNVAMALEQNSVSQLERAISNTQTDFIFILQSLIRVLTRITVNKYAADD